MTHTQADPVPIDTGGAEHILSAGLRDHVRVVVVTGAGISAASGIPTYRSHGSGWDDPDLERKSHARAYGNHLLELWQFWGRLRTLTAAAAPNAAHVALTGAALRCQAAGGWLTVVTQNVDGLHTSAGTPDVVELHGSIHRSRCLRRGCGTSWPDQRIPDPGQALQCVRCSRAARPDVVLFGEKVHAATLDRARAQLRRADLCLYVGTSGTVWPASDLLTTARDAGVRRVLVNVDPWDTCEAEFDDVVLGSAEHLLPTLIG